MALIDSCAACGAMGQVTVPLRVAVHDVVAVVAVAVEESSGAEGAVAPSRVRLPEVN